MPHSDLPPVDDTHVFAASGIDTRSFLEVLRAATVHDSGLEQTLGIYLDDSGLRFAGVGHAQIVAVDAFLSSDSFDEYDANGGVIGVRPQELRSAIDPASDSCRLTEADLPNTIALATNTESRLFNVWLGGRGDGLAGSCVSFEWLDPDNYDGTARPPNLYDAETVELVVDGDALRRDIRLAGEREDEEIRLRYGPSHRRSLSFSATGDSDSLHAEYDATTSLRDARGAVEEPSHVSVSAEHLMPVADTIPPGREVTVAIGTDDWPMKVAYPFFDGDGTATFFASPRV